MWTVTSKPTLTSVKAKKNPYVLAHGCLQGLDAASLKPFSRKWWLSVNLPPELSGNLLMFHLPSEAVQTILQTQRSLFLFVFIQGYVFFFISASYMPPFSSADPFTFARAIMLMQNRPVFVGGMLSAILTVDFASECNELLLLWPCMNSLSRWKEIKLFIVKTLFTQHLRQLIFSIATRQELW